MYLQMMVVNFELFVLGEKKDKKEDDVDMFDGKQELFREKMEERLCELERIFVLDIFFMLYNYI